MQRLEADYGYDAVDTCAVDGMCETACPLHINTGDLMKRLRAEQANSLVNAGWSVAARHWGALTGVASAAMTLTRALPDRVVTVPNRLARRVVDPDVLPLWSPELPGGGTARPSGGTAGAPRGAAAREVVYFTACVGSMFGPSTEGPGVRPALESLCSRAGITLVLPDDLPGLCCGTPWRSKGMTNGAHEMEHRLLESLWRATRGGELDIVCDASSCTEGVRQTIQKAAVSPDSPYAGLRVRDAVSFVAEHVLPELPPARRIGSLALHPTCSSTRMGINDALRTLAEAVAERVVVPDAWGCCAFAGDRGMLHPELTASATAGEAREVRAGDHDAHASSNRTCELGMTRATGREYQHVLELLDRATSPAE